MQRFLSWIVVLFHLEYGLGIAMAISPEWKAQTLGKGKLGAAVREQGHVPIQCSRGSQ